jgi:hypothetical protein
MVPMACFIDASVTPGAGVKLGEHAGKSTIALDDNG